MLNVSKDVLEHSQIGGALLGGSTGRLSQSPYFALIVILLFIFERSESAVQ